MANATTSILSGGFGFLTKIESMVDIRPASPAVGAAGHLRYYVAICCVLLAVFVFRSRKSKMHPDIPFFKASKAKWIFDAETLVRDSYGQYHDKIYQIKATEGVQVLVPPKFIAELKGLPEETLSATEAVNDAMLSSYTKFCLGHNSELLLNLLRTKLTQNLARLVPQLKTEIEDIVASEFPACDDWTAIKVQPLGVRAIARLSGRAFVGPSINRNKEWIDTSINYAIHVFIAAVKLQFFPEWMRPVGQYLVSELRQTRRDVARARAMVQPIIEERLREKDNPEFERPDDFCQWLLDTLPEAEKRDYQSQAELQLILSAASIHTTSNLLADCIFDLAAHPEAQEELRREVAEVLNGDGAWARKDSMVRLKKMDSFIKEVQRLSGNITTFIRKVIKPEGIDLSDGTHLPAGTKILSPLAGVARDDRYYPSADAFDPLRFFRMRQQSDEDANRWQLTSISDTSLNFGAGKHACPGRFFAGNEIKMMLSYLLLRFDLRLKDGADRPRPMTLMMTKTPNPNGEVLFRRRAVETA